MARSRFVKPEFFDDTLLARCSHPARLLFVATWQIADRLGVFEWDCVKLRKYVFGYEDITVAQIDSMLDELLAQGFIRRGTFKNKAYGLVVNLAKHQKFHVAEKSKYDEAFAGAIWQASSKNPVLAPTQHPAGTLPESLSLFPVPLRPSLETETETETVRVEQETKPSKGKKPGRSASDQARAKQVKEAFFAGYRQRYGRECPIWGVPHNTHIYHLLESNTLDDLVTKAQAYFAWPNKKAIDAGHPFMGHFASFSSTLAELTADMIAPQRRRESAQVNAMMKTADDIAADDDELSRLKMREAAQKDPFDERQWRSTGEIGPANPGQIAAGSAADVGGALEAHERSGNHRVVQSTGSVRERGDAVAVVGRVLRGSQHAEHPRHQEQAPRAAGTRRVQADPRADAGREGEG